MKIEITPRAYEDLESIKYYISHPLQNPQSAQVILTDIMKCIRSLDKLPDRGSPLNTIVPTKSDYRFIQSHNYVIFYRTEETRVLIVRILYRYRNFMKVLFSDDTPDAIE